MQVSPSRSYEPPNAERPKSPGQPELVPLSKVPMLPKTLKAAGRWGPQGKLVKMNKSPKMRKKDKEKKKDNGGDHELPNV